MPAARILLIDDHALFRSGLRMVLSSAMENIEILEADSLEEALRVANTPPNIILLDIELRGLNGLDGIALLKREWSLVPIVVVSADSTRETVHTALQRGAARFVSKAERPEKILSIIHQVLNGSPDQSDTFDVSAASKARLTPRQCEVLDFLCQGLSNKVIGRRLSLSENTVRGHVQALFVALNVVSRSEAAFAARLEKLVN